MKAENKIKKIIIGGILISLLVLGFLAIRYILGGPEDSWLCVKGQWVKHGNPASPKPTVNCAPILKE
jgi:hypothetical protein